MLGSFFSPNPRSKNTWGRCGVQGPSICLMRTV